MSYHHTPFKTKALILFTILTMWYGTFYNASAQEPARTPYRSMGLHFHKSILLPSPNTSHLFTAIPWGLEAEYLFHTHGKEDWQPTYNYPVIGIMGSFYDYQNPQLGKMYGLSSILYMPLWNSAPIQIIGGIGLAYTPVHHDVESNPQNDAIGGPATFLVQLGLVYEQDITKRIGVKAELKGVHFSSGGLTIPNFGLNMLQSSIGATYDLQLTKQDGQSLPQNKPSINPGLGVYIGSGVGGKAVKPSGTPLKPVYSASVILQKSISKVNILSFSTTFVGGPARRYIIRRDAQVRGHSSKPLPDHRLLGLNIGHELLIGKLAIVTQLGYHVYNKIDKVPDSYQLAGLKYYWKQQRFFCSLLLKTYGYGASDYVGAGFGVRLN